MSPVCFRPYWNSKPFFANSDVKFIKLLKYNQQSYYDETLLSHCQQFIRFLISYEFSEILLIVKETWHLIHFQTDGYLQKVAMLLTRLLTNLFNYWVYVFLFPLSFRKEVWKDENRTFLYSST